MLIAKFYINKDKLEEIHIHNTGKLTSLGQAIYNVYLGEDGKNGEDESPTFKVFHDRENGWEKLVSIVLDRKRFNEVAKKLIRWGSGKNDSLF